MGLAKERIMQQERSSVGCPNVKGLLRKRMVMIVWRVGNVMGRVLDLNLKSV